MTRVKICGVTSVHDVELCADAGADAVGFNFYARSPRCVDVAVARRLVQALSGRALAVGVFVDASYEQIEAIKTQTGIDCVQLHGAESPDLLARLLPHAYKAVRVRDAGALDDARSFGGEHILLDAYVAGVPGGTGARFDWALAAELAAERKVTLAGGLTPDNVAAAVARVRPYCVDVASGVEAAPGRKDATKVRDFVRAAKG